MAAFAGEDALVKAVSAALSMGQILIGFRLVGTAICAVIAHRQRDALMTSDIVSPVMRVRVLFEITGGCSMCWRWRRYRFRPRL